MKINVSLTAIICRRFFVVAYKIKSTLTQKKTRDMKICILCVLRQWDLCFEATLDRIIII